MPDYSKGVIYTIRNKNDATKIYVGSTSQPLYKRFHQHKINCKKESNMNIKFYVEVANDWTNWYIELYENYSCNNKNELCKREGEVIREIGTLNSKIEGRDKKQYRLDNADKIKEQKKEYYINNADKIKEHYIDNADKIKQYRIENADKIKQYYIDNADKILENKKEYYINNADKIKEQSKEYYINNADKIKEQNKQYRINNIDKIKEKNKQYYIENADKNKEQRKQYYIDKKINIQ